jgi:hypothetical protein
MSKTSTLHEYARVGAAARITELRAEIASIHELFSDIGEAHKSPGRSKGALAALMDPAPKRKMSAAGRKAISEAQKKRWAALKAGKKR